MPGEQFSRSHLHPGAPGQDSTRARYRVGALLIESGELKGAVRIGPIGSES
jgi:hypothetical protein